MKGIEDIQEMFDNMDNIIKNRGIEEGIDFDVNNLTVSYNPNHEDNVDTSTENNPTKDNEILLGVPVWSIFKRKRGLRGDGNPLIYALKNEKGWHFRNDKDYLMVMKQFDKIAEKFISLYPVGLTIVVPSSSPLNEYIATKIVQKSKNARILKNILCKLTTEDVDDIVMAPNSAFRLYYKNNFVGAYNELVQYLDIMDKTRNGYFTRHLVRNNDMRDVLDFTLKTSTDASTEDANSINGEDVLIIDDTISRGQTIKEACQIIQDTYAPKSVTVLTLLSKLY